MLVVRHVSAICPRRPGLYGVAMAVTRRLLTAGTIGAAAATAAGLGVRARGQHIANTTDPELDPLLEAPEGVSHHRLATFDGGAVHVAELGQGPPVMLCHGVTLQWEVWSPLFRLLAEDHRVLAWDMRGHGESHAGDEGVSLRAVATDLVTVLSTLGIAALFSPLRSRVQGFIDRRFYRKKYDAEQALSRFAVTARDVVDLRALSSALLEVVDETLQPETVNLQLKDGYLTNQL